jgi:glycerol-3-phosphate dehydrogenase
MMQRNLNQLANQTFDLLVIGAGIYGSFVAWDAALRGLSVVLIDRGDFGNATSANSLKIIHGGLRYLQDLNIRRVRGMVSERRAWLKIAPHLVHPLPFLMPTTRRITRSKTVLQTALRLSDLIGYDRNDFLDPQKWLPASQVLSKGDFLARVPGLKSQDVTGGAMWYDAQMYSSERLLFSVVRSAHQQGAVVANYIQATGFLRNENEIRGVIAEDVFTDQEFHIRARVVVIATGPWTDSLLNAPHKAETSLRFRPSIAINLVTRQILDGFALGVPSRYFITAENGSHDLRSRLLFIVPWRGYSIIGTLHVPYDGTPEGLQVDEHTIGDFLAEINAAYPPAQLSRDDVYHIHSGLLPVVDGDQSRHSVRLLRESVVYDHYDKDGLSGLISVIGVKYTTARSAAEIAIDLVFNKLGWEAPPCRTHETPLYGGQIDRFSDFVARAVSHRPHGLDPEVIERLVYHYGSQYHQILDYLDEDPNFGQTIRDNSLIIKAEIVHAVRAEMAQTLADVVLRRTGLGAAGPPDIASLRACAEIMGAELGWDQDGKNQQIDDVLAAYPLGSKAQVKEEIVI